MSAGEDREERLPIFILVLDGVFGLMTTINEGLLFVVVIIGLLFIC